MYHERKCYVLNIITGEKRSQAGGLRPSAEDNRGENNGSTNSTLAIIIGVTPSWHEATPVFTKFT